MSAPWLLFPLLLLLTEPPGHRFLRLISPELRALEVRGAALRNEMNALPIAPEDHTAARIGWHSTFNFNRRRAESRSVTLDLGSLETFGSVVLIPVCIAEGAGYGFPVRFRIEAAEERSFAAPLLLGDFSAVDFPNPGQLPVFVPTPGGHGRYICVTATQLFARGSEALLALGELMVWKGDTNLAVGKTSFASGSYDNAPAWQLANLNDGESVLGPPVRPAAPRGHGYHSQIALREDEVKWVQLDLGASVPIDEVRLFPARPHDFPARSGFGFPQRFRVEISDTPDFARATALVDFRDVDCVNPGDNPFLVPGAGAARYVRVTATRLWERHHDFCFALSEMQVLSDGQNLARRATPSALDSININRWQLEFLNDGLSSQGELVDWPVWLRGLSRRRELMQEWERLMSTHEPLVAAAWRRLGVWSAAIFATGAALALLFASRQRAARQRELSGLRQRIASDLHDEIGSNLGSIALLAGMASENLREGARQDVVQIQQIAQETAASMRDIVWLTRPGVRTAADLVARMREVATRQLAGLEWKLEGGELDGPLPLEFEREVLLLFKEALHNIRKHAHADSVVINFARMARSVRLRIKDDGEGFDPTRTVTGTGLTSMRHRATQLGALLTISSTPGEGTKIDLEIPLP